MKLNLFFLLCLTGLVPVAISILKTLPHGYHLMMAQVTWPVAQNHCRMMYTDVGTILSGTDWLRLKKEATRNGLATSAWVGLYNDINSWRWSLNGFPLKNVTYSNWKAGEPDNYAGKEACAIMAGYGTWDDASCTEAKPFICYSANFSGKFIRISSPLLPWAAAQSYCRTYHTDLASSLNSSDNNMLMNLRDMQGDSWIGLYRDTWKWSDGTNASNLPWAPGQPDNYGGIENCAVVYNEQFNDECCTNLHYYFCHTILPVREQQMMKLHVMSDGSIFEPAVQSSILEQMKQKLEENGMMMNTTVSWKVRSDGNVFYKKNNDGL